MLAKPLFTADQGTVGWGWPVHPKRGL